MGMVSKRDVVDIEETCSTVDTLYCPRCKETHIAVSKIGIFAPNIAFCGFEEVKGDLYKCKNCSFLISGYALYKRFGIMV